MKRIPLRARDGSIRDYALVDDDDFDWLNQWRWCVHGEGYACRTTPRPKRRTILMHRAIMGERVDHKDRNGLNNQRANLRPCTQAQNLQNKALARNNTSGLRGVSWNKQQRKWHAHAKLDGRMYSLGFYRTKQEASHAVSEFRASRMPFSDDATQITS